MKHSNTLTVVKRETIMNDYVINMVKIITMAAKLPNLSHVCFYESILEEITKVSQSKKKLGLVCDTISIQAVATHIS